MDKKVILGFTAAVVLFGGVFLVGMKKQDVAQQPVQHLNDENLAGKSLTFAQQLKLKASLEMLSFWQIRSIFQSPKNPQVFYFILNEQKEARIVKYDTSKVNNYLQNESVDFPAYIENILFESLSVGLELRAVGFDGNNFVFTKTSTENSPGPCFSPWFYTDLSSIEVGTALAVRKPYTLSVERKAKLQEEEKICREAL